MLINKRSATTTMPNGATQKAEAAQALLHSCDGPGIAAAVLQGNERIFAHCCGAANLAHRIPITADTVFPVASITKTFSGLACLIAEQEGKLNRHDSIAEYLPEFSHYGDITIQHLLDMQSGLREILRIKECAGLGIFDNRAHADFISAFKAIESRNYHPGTRYSYANTNFILLAMLLEHVYDTSYADVIQSLFLYPLGMNNSYVIDAPWPNLPGLANCYLYNNTLDIYQCGTPKTPSAGGGNIYATLNDLCKWLLYLREGKHGDFTFQPLISAPNILPNNQDGAYTNGFMNYTYNGLACFGHDGDWPGLKSALYYYPEADTGIIIIANSDSHDIYKYLLGLADIYLESEQKQREKTSTVFYERLYCDAASGHYLKTYIDKDTCYAGFAGKPKVPLTPAGVGTWQMPYGSRRLEITFQTSNQLLVRWNGRDLVFEKAKPLTTVEIDAHTLCGRYYNDELQTFHTIYWHNSELYLRMGGPWNASYTYQISHIDGDVFALGDSFTLMLRRDENTTIIGYSLHDERLDDVRFIKA